MSTLYQIIIVALLAAFTILYLGKSGNREKLRNFCDENELKLFAELIDCDFCLSFWVGLVCYVFLLFFGVCELNILVPFCAAPIARYLV